VPAGLSAGTARSGTRAASSDWNVLLLKIRQVGRILVGVLDYHQIGEDIMAIQIVMDRTGDSRHPFNPHDAQEVAKAEQRFYELTKAGFTAAVRTGSGQTSQIRSFDPTAEQTLFFPRLVGGQ
jgi:hypothetical protein